MVEISITIVCIVISATAGVLSKMISHRNGKILRKLECVGDATTNAATAPTPSELLT